MGERYPVTAAELSTRSVVSVGSWGRGRTLATQRSGFGPAAALSRVRPVQGGGSALSCPGRPGRGSPYSGGWMLKPCGPVDPFHLRREINPAAHRSNGEFQIPAYGRSGSAATTPAIGGHVWLYIVGPAHPPQPKHHSRIPSVRKAWRATPLRPSGHRRAGGRGGLAVGLLAALKIMCWHVQLCLHIRMCWHRLLLSPAGTSASRRQEPQDGRLPEPDRDGPRASRS